MSQRERELYPTTAAYLLNQVLLPLKLMVPQPLVGKISLLTTNKAIRDGLVLSEISGRLLDIGCGENELVRAYRQFGGHGIGIDVYPWPGVDRVVENSGKLPFEDGSFDTITFVACINHIPNRREALHDACRVLTDNGRLVITNLAPTVSRIWHFFAFWDKDQHERGMKEGEVWGFTTAELIEMLSEAGFEVLEMARFSWGLNQLLLCAKKRWV
jgi:SAM-dependent methyltransferase